MSVYVTVGSTGFDELVKAVCTQEFMQALASQGFQRLMVQCGSSLDLFTPPTTRSESFGISIESFDYTNWPQRLIEQADLVICHAGTGSILEALHSGKPTIVVVNPSLMDNHQREIAEELATEGYVVEAKPDLLAKAILQGEYTGLRPYPAADPRPIGEIIDQETLRDPEWKKEFVRYIDEERKISKERFPAMALSTVDLDGRPSVRMVSPRGFVGDGFLKISQKDTGQWTSDILTFCTHAQSNKVSEL
ncbi:hypothetical protein IWW36_004849, partial [Coemansia brasiliensis]